MRVALSAWFSGRLVGSGQYTDRLTAALLASATAEDHLSVVEPTRHGGLAKLWFEQVDFPRRARGADLAHVPYWAPPWVQAVPTVITVHDLIPLVLAEYRERWAMRAYAGLARRASSRVAAVIADSEHTASDIRRHLGVAEARLHVVSLGVDPVAPVSESVRAAMLHRLGLPSRFGLYLGGFDRRKNLATLLAAWREVHRTTDIPLVLAGRLPRAGDPLAPDPTGLARAVGLPDAAWRAVGPIGPADRPILYAAASVFAFPSRYEGFGLPPLEAMASGCPVVVAAATSLPGVVGKAGLLVAPDDVPAWSAALGRVLTDDTLAADLAAAGRLRAAEFSWEGTTAATRAVYKTVLGRTP